MPLLLTYVVSDDESAVNLIKYLLCDKLLLSAFKSSRCLAFDDLIMTYLGVDLFTFILLEVCPAFQICRLMLFTKFGDF